MDQRGSTARKLSNVIRRARQHPAWLGETVRGKIRARADLKRPFSLRDHQEHLVDGQGAVTAAYGIGPEAYESLQRRVRIPPGRDDAPWSGGDILDLAGVVVLLTRPKVVVETGVAMGYTTAVVLAAMQDNDSGTLHSIDLPPLQVDAPSFIGQVVPTELRTRWTLHLGPTRTLLSPLASSVAPIDVFVHDSDHSYAGQHEDFRRVWPHLRRGGTFICDDVCNPAFIEFAAEVGERPLLIAPPGQPAAVGLITKS